MTDLKYSVLFPKLLQRPSAQNPDPSRSGPGARPTTRGFPIYWCVADLVWLPFLPAVVTYHHPIFTDMNRYPDVIHVENGFILDSSAVRHWYSVEFIIRTATEKIFSSTSTAHHRPPFYPSSYGYRQTFPTKKEAKSVAKASVSAFHHALAYCSYAMASVDFPRSELESYEDLAGAPSVLQNLITDDASRFLLKQLWSTLGEMRRMRNFSGVVVSYDRPCDCQSVQRMYRYGVPVFVRWSPGSHSQSYCEFPQSEILAKWCPPAGYFAVLASPRLHLTSFPPPVITLVESKDEHPWESSRVSSPAPVDLLRVIGEFLFSRYGVIQISEVTDPSKNSAWSAVLGVCGTPPKSLVHLYNWVTAGHWPLGMCDVSPDLIHASLLTSRRFRSAVRVTFLQECQSYLVSVAEGWSVGWTLIISDPLTVLQMKREGWDDPHDLINGLIKKGAPFCILNPENLEAPLIHDNPRSFIEWPQDGGLTYPAYRQQLRKFFIRWPHAYGAALAAGGILWRIATDVLPSPNGTDVVHPFHRNRRVSRIIGGKEYWTPSLTQLESDIIVGVYKWIIHRFNAADEEPAFSAGSFREESWWPKPQMWRESGLEFGVWAPLNEEWYMNRAIELEEGDGRLIEVKEWRSKIEFKKEDAAKFISCAQHLTKKYLREHRW